MLCLMLRSPKDKIYKDASSFRIGHDIIVHVLKSSDTYVCVGIEAPKDVVILRETVYQRAISERLAGGKDGKQ